MKTLILFGRSPFINEVDVPRILEAGHDTAGCNNFAAQFPVTTSWCLDRYIAPMSDKTQVFVRSRREAPPPPGAIAIRPCSVPEPFLDDQRDNLGNQMLAWARFTPGAILNWAILQGYEAVYLVGVDHYPTDTRFEHYDGIDNEFGQNILPEMHERFRAYVMECSKHIKIYQTNPGVMRWWAIPYKGLIRIYG